jgi:predicted transcriptional regulator
MPKGSSGSGGGGGGRGDIPSDANVRGRVDNEKQPSHEVVTAFTNAKIKAAEEFPELKGQIYNDMNKVTQGDIKTTNGKADGIYVESKKKVVIDNSVAKKGGERLQDVTRHEVGHGLAIKPRRGFNDVDTTFDKAYTEYKQTHPRATEGSFAKSISPYAAKAKSEAHAEAFADYLKKGNKAAEASRLMMKHWRK